MRRRLLTLALVSLACFLASSPALAAPKRTTVVLIPVDRHSGTAAVRFSEYLESAIAKRNGYILREAATALGDTTPTAALEARKRLIGSLGEGRNKFKEGLYDEAESALRTALVDVDNASAAMERCGEYCEALAYLAGAQLLKGEEQGAREVLKTLLGIERSFKFDSSVFGKNMMVLVRDVQREIAHQNLVNVTVHTVPAGGRVYLDGQYKGFAPLTVERVSAGRHLVRVERPGSVTWGQLIDASTSDEVTVKAKLTTTPEYSALESSLDRVADELERGEGGNELMRLGGKLKVDRAIIGTVRSGGSRVSLDLVLVDFAQRKKLARKSRSFDGDEYGELEREVERFGNLLLAEGEPGRQKTKKSDDPLDDRSGIENWDEEGSGSADFEDEKPKKKAPAKKRSSASSDESADW